MVRARFLTGVLAVVMGLAGCGGASAPAAKSGAFNAAPESAAADMPPGAQGQPAPAPASEAGASIRGDFKAEQEAPKEPSNRPGLGTTWGETRDSKITSAPFSRADASNAFATSALFYNDEEGARSMATASGFRRFSEGSIDVGGGVVSARLKGGDGRFLSGFEASGKKFVVGQAGDRYSIVLQSHVPARLEVVVSVDGLDVIDGKAASFSKRGYLIDPHGQIEIDGFRQSMDQVAAFRFGSVRNSYAEKKTGDSRNVGVIGIALFNEQGTNPASWPRGDTQKRLDANPFPGQFATPPSN
ncbi:MAG: hypothetical protein JNL21_00500 [Myxococcales bacterium]|nr:hypothetical protein [Myxococcales bacterium]